MNLVTPSGRVIDPANPRESDISIDDIAYGLAKEERFDGNTIVPYSVAQHSVHVANFIATMAMADRYSRYDNWEEEVMAGLLHDATEAYLGDMVSPLKRILPDYCELEAKWNGVIFRRFNLDPELVHSTAVKTADNTIFKCEALCLTREPEKYGVNRVHAGELLDQVHNVYHDIGSITAPHVWDRRLAAKRFLETAVLLNLKIV